MPLDRYYGGHGNEVMRKMKKRYGDAKAEQVFYATANKNNQNPTDKPKKRRYGK